MFVERKTVFRPFADAVLKVIAEAGLLLFLERVEKVLAADELERRR